MNGIYQSIYDLIVRYIYGGVVNVGSFEELTTIMLSTIFCILILAIPFVVAFLGIKLLYNLCSMFMSIWR